MEAFALKLEEEANRLPRGLVPYDQAPVGWDVEALDPKLIGLEPPLPPLPHEEDLPW